jgi:outer membrane lipoprotein-sorting protein
MTDRNEHQPVDVLDRATGALRDTFIPDGPSPQLAASTVEALQSASIPPDVVRLMERKRKMFRFMRLSGAAAAVVLVAIFAAWLLLMDRTAVFAFADVVEKVKNAKSVTFVLKSEIGSQPAMLQNFYIQGTAYRMEIPSKEQAFPVPPDAPPVLMALIADAKQKQTLRLDYVRKTAQKLPVDDKQWEEMAKADVIEQFRHLTDKDAERIGEEQLNSRKTSVYRLKKVDFFGEKGVVEEGGSAKVWIDAESQLPVRMELVNVSADRKHKATMLFEQFTWNQPLDMELFRLEVPKGFIGKRQ